MSRLHHARKRLRHRLGPILAVVLALLALVAGFAVAQPPPGAPPPPADAPRVVRFGARVLLASDAPPSAALRVAPAAPDERLQAFLPKLRQLFSYREYTSLERYRAEVPLGVTQRWSVPGERQLELTPEGLTDNAVRFRLRLQRGGLAELNTNIQVARGSPFVVGGPRHADGVLIIIVWTNPNPERR